MLFFTSDEHYGHRNIIDYCDRPFKSVEEMDEEIIQRHNKVVRGGDVVVHAGDFTLANAIIARRYLSKLNGKKHIFLKGSHDKWLNDPLIKSEFDPHEIMEFSMKGEYIVVCHYSMRVWPRSHYNSWQLYGHSHGRLAPVGKQYDIGVDNNNFYPVSFDKIREIMKDSVDNFNLIKNRWSCVKK